MSKNCEVEALRQENDALRRQVGANVDAQVKRQSPQPSRGFGGANKRKRPTDLTQVVYVDQFLRLHDAYIERTYTIKLQTSEVDPNHPDRFLSVAVEYVDLCMNANLDGSEKWVSVPGVPNVNEPYLQPKIRCYKTFSQVEDEKRRRVTL